MKILILKRDKIGDMLLLTPMLAHLRAVRPQAEIHVLANDYNAWVVTDNPHIDRLWVYPRLRHGARLRPAALFAQLRQLLALRAVRFDVAIAAGGVVSPRAIGRLRRLAARRTIAYCAGESCRGLSDPLPLPPGVHEVQANFGLLAPLGIDPPSAPIWPQYELPAQWQEFGRQWCAQRGLEPGRFIVLGVNARRMKRKPTLAQIGRWAAHFHAAWGMATVLMWQPGPWEDRLYPGDDAYVAPLLADAPPYLHPFRSEGSVLPALGIVWQAATSIFPDGGIAHLASVSPGGVLALFADTQTSPHPDNWRPWGPNSAFLEAPREVSELSDAAVFAAALANIERRSS